MNEQHHEEMIKVVAREEKLLLDESAQAIYIYFDDTHKVCNKKFADLLGYKSPGEWAKMDAPLADVMEKDQPKVVAAYGKAAEKLIASKIEISMKNIKTGKVIKTSLVMAPIVLGGHVFVMNFFK
jgi:hypothetical protein